MNTTEIRRILDRAQIRLTKSLGQNFLHDANQLKRIVAAADLAEGDQVLEIGPGLGALTQILVDRGMPTLAIEKDARLCQYLSHHFADRPCLSLVHDDALRYLQVKDTSWSDWKVVSNLPYSVASPILVELAKSKEPPKRIVVTLQLEVAQRVVAKASDDSYGVLSLLLQRRFEPSNLFKIPPACFFPAPNVDSACLTLERRSTLLVDPSLVRAFEKIVKRSFSQRRKMMLKLLKADWPLPRLESAFAELGIHPQARAETVTLEQYAKLAHRLERTDIQL